MLVSLLNVRVGARRLAIGTLLLLPLVACSGGNLLLPDDRTPVQLRAVSGNGQAAPAGAPVPNPLVVEALDRAGRPVEGAAILFQFVDPPDGAAIAPPATETGPEGRASVEVTLGRPAGDQPVEASLNDPEQNVRVRFLLTAIQSNNGGGGDDGDDDPPPDDGNSGPGNDGGGGGGGGGQADGGGSGGGGDDVGGGGGGDDHDGKGKGKGKSGKD